MDISDAFLVIADVLMKVGLLILFAYCLLRLAIGWPEDCDEPAQLAHCKSSRQRNKPSR